MNKSATIIRTVIIGLAGAIAVVSSAGAQSPTGPGPAAAPAPPASVESLDLGDPVETTTLASDAFSIRVLEEDEGALDPSLWRGARADQVSFLFDQAPKGSELPSVNALARRVFLSGGDAPTGADVALHEKKLLTMIDAGLLDDARSIAGLSAVPYDKANATLALYSGDVATACSRASRVTSADRDLFWVKLRVLCYVASGERNAADLTFNVLTERDALSTSEKAYLQAAISQAVPVSEPVTNALTLAIANGIDGGISPAMIVDAPGGVIVAIAQNENAALATRITAARTGVAMGILPATILPPLLQAVELSVVELGNVRNALQARPDDPTTDALVYQAVSEMSAPEFARDKAALIADTISAARSFEVVYARSKVYASDIEQMEGLLASPEMAAAFALSSAVNGDREAAFVWLSGMLGDAGSIVNLSEAQAASFVEKVTLFANLDGVAAAALAERAGVILGEDKYAALLKHIPMDDGKLAQVIDAAFDANASQSVGQAGLVALVVADQASFGGKVEGVVLDRALSILDVPTLRNQIAFERALATRYRHIAPQAPAAAARDDEVVEEGGIRTPRIKPRGR